MLGDIDYDIQKIKPRIYLAKTDRTLISILSDAFNINYSIQLGAISTLEFDLPYRRENSSHELVSSNASLIKYLYLLKLQLNSDTEWFLINKPGQDNMTDNSDYMHITAKSLPIELAKKNIHEYSATSYNPTQVLTDLLSDTIWTIGTIDSSLDEKYRSYSFTSSNIYDAIIQIAEKVDGVLQFDTVNRTISIDKLEDIGVDRGLRIKKGRLLRTLNRDYDVSNSISRLIPYGDSGITISAVTPNGQNWVQDFSPFTTSTYMSTSLVSAIQTYEALLDGKEPTIQTASTSTTSTNICLPLHNLNTGEWILNSDRSNAYREISGVPDVNNITIATAITGMTVNDVIYKYSTSTFRYLLFKKEDFQNELTTLRDTDLDTLETELVVLQNAFEVVQDSATKYTAENATTTTNIEITSNNASTGYWVYNENQTVYREITAITDANNFVVTAVTGQTMGDTIFIYNDDPTGADRDAKIVEVNNKKDSIDDKNAEISSLQLVITVTTAATATGNITFSIDGSSIIVPISGATSTTGVATIINSAFEALYVYPDTDYLSSVSSNVVTLYFTTIEDEADVTITYTDTDITGVGTTIATTNYGVSNQISEMVNETSMATNFSTGELSELNPFIIEQEWTNEFFSDAQDLYEATQEELSKRNILQPSLDISIVNFLEVVEQQHNWDKIGVVNLGDTIYIENETLNVDVTAKIIQIDFDFENADIKLKIADINNIRNSEDKALDWINDFINSKNEFNIKKINYNTVYTNFDGRNDRISITPANPTIASDGTGLERTLNPDGSVDISFSWSFSGSGDAYNIDGFKVFVRSALTPESYIFGSSTAKEQVYDIAPNKRAFKLNGVAATQHYSFGVQSYRVVDDDIDSDGIIKSSIVQPSLASENPYQPATDLSHNEIGKSTATFVIADASTSNNIKRADYIVPGGSTSAQNTINAVINTLPAGGGNVTLLDGTYTINGSIVLNSNVSLTISAGATILAASGVAASYNAIENDDLINGNNNIQIKGEGVIDGNKDNVTGFSMNGIYLRYVTNSLISVGLIKDTVAHGIQLSNSTKNNIISTTVDNCDADGINLATDYNIISNNTCTNNGESGINIIGSHNTVGDNTFNNNGYCGIYALTSSNNIMNNNNIKGNSYDGIQIKTSSNDNVIVGNTCVNNSQIGNDMRIGIYLANSSHYNNIQNNICRKGETIIHSGTAVTATTGTITLAASASTVDGAYINFYIEITGGTASGQTNTISDYIGSTRVATVVAWGVIPDNTSTYEIKNYPKYGIQIATGCNNNLVTNNDIYDSGFSGNLLDSGSGTITVAGNRS